MKQHRTLTAIAEFALLFLPAIPAYLWVWPRLAGISEDAFQVLSYLYLLAGALFIGLRRWKPGQIGWNRSGLGLSLASGIALLTGRTLIILGVDWDLWPEPFDPGRLAWEIFFYIALVGLVEEWLFRGVLYKILEEWRGITWAILGSSLAFGLYHVGWQGWAGLLGGLIIGGFFAVVRWRTGNFIGLIFVHGLIDILAVEMLPMTNPQEFGRPGFLHPWYIVAGLILMIAPVLILTLGYRLWRTPCKIRIPPS